MMAAHLLPADVLLVSVGSGVDAVTERLVDGRPSILFAVVAGVALGLVMGGNEPWRRHRWSARGRLALRAVLLIALGLVLWMLPSGIAVILDYYGVMFLLLVPLLFLSRGVLFALVALLFFLVPQLVSSLVQIGFEPEGIGATIADYLLFGWYPALVWLPLVMLGLFCARAGLQLTWVRVALLVAGALTCWFGYSAAPYLPLGTAAAHSGSTGELLGSGGLAVSVIALLVIVLDSGALSRIPRVVLAPLSAIGRVPLTVYAMHVVVIALLSDLGPAGFFAPDVGLTLWLAFSIGGAVLGLVLGHYGWRGPLEAALSWLSALGFRDIRHAPPADGAGRRSDP